MNKNSKSKGFTIIEALIVLAIAGAIILVVLLAVPALRRNQRNTQRKNDVSSLTGAVSEYISNNNGALPPDLASLTTNAKLSLYDASTDVIYGKNTTVQNSASSWTDISKVYIETYAKCNGNALASGSVATSRNVVAYYYVETASGATGGAPQCVDI